LVMTWAVSSASLLFFFVAMATLRMSLDIS
jgi:hypothetical protein